MWNNENDENEFYPQVAGVGIDFGGAFGSVDPSSPSFIGAPKGNTAPVMAPASVPLANLPGYYIQMSLGVPVGSANWNVYQAAARDATLKLAAQQVAAMPNAAATQASSQLIAQQQATLTGPEPTTAAGYLARGALRTAEAGKYDFTDANFSKWTQLANDDYEKAKTVVTTAAPDRVLAPAELAQVLAAPIPAYNAPVELQKWIAYYLGLAHGQQVHT